MSLGEVLLGGFLALVRQFIGMAFMVWLFVNLHRLATNKWGRPEGSLSPFDPRRWFCRHRVCYLGAGTAGLWAFWCSACGRKTGDALVRRRRP